MNGKTTWKDLVLAAILLTATIIIVTTIARDNNYVPPENTKVDSLMVANDSINLVIKKKDSVKYEKIQEVLKLDNDSTLELFKQLVRE